VIDRKESFAGLIYPPSGEPGSGRDPRSIGITAASRRAGSGSAP
jgi:hypothetical protein